MRLVSMSATDQAGVSFGVSRPFFLSTGNLAHLGDAVASIRWHDAGRQRQREKEA
jgi:hypothetical protein